MKKLKRVIAIMIAMVTCVAMFSVTALTENGEVSAEPEIEESGICGDNLTWKLDSDGTLTITGTGVMYDETGFVRIVSSPEHIKKVVVEEGVTTIGTVAFFECDGLTEITLPSSITSIGAYAFGGCSSLSEITIPSNVTSINEGTFGQCSSLTAVEIPNTVTSIGDYAFSGCSELKQVILPDGLSSIGIGAFYNCSSLTEITIPASITDMSDSIFAKCSSLQKVTLQDGLNNVGAGAFSGCSSLADVEIPNSVTSIEYNAFNSCASLLEVTIPSNVTSIGGGTFEDCSSLSSVYFMGDAPEFRADRSEFEVSMEPFANVTANVYYTYGNNTWTSENMLDYGGTLTWLTREPSTESELAIIEESTDSVYIIGSSGGATIACTGAFKDFVSVAVDGNILDSSYYTVRAGSTILTIMSEYLDTLSVGKHVVTLNYTYGSIDTILTIIDRASNSTDDATTADSTDKNSGSAGSTDTNISGNAGNSTDTIRAPKTGDCFSAALWGVVGLSAICSCLAVTKKRKTV